MIAYHLRRYTAVTNGWLSHHPNMGVINGVSRYVAALERAKKHKHRAYKRMIARIKPVWPCSSKEVEERSDHVFNVVCLTRSTVAPSFRMVRTSVVSSV